MDKQDQSLAVSRQMQQILTRMVQMQAELDRLKSHSQISLQPTAPQKKDVSTTRRKTLKRLGLALLGGATAATFLGNVPAQARLIANPTINGLTNKAGAVILPPGAMLPSGIAPNFTYGLIASGNTTDALDMNALPGANTGFYGTGTYGLYGNGTDSGVYGTGYYGVQGNGSLYGVRGIGETAGVYGTANNIGVYGSGPMYGVEGISTKTGVYGASTTDTGTGVAGSGGVIGGLFYSNSTISGSLDSTTHIGVLGTAGGSSNLTGFLTGHKVGVYGSAGGTGSNLFAGYFDGNIKVNGNLNVSGNISGGTLTKPGGTFKIDHPLDPANKYLYHSFVESPDMMNLYNGLVTLNKQGETTVEMPDWFEALNMEYRYQLTALDQAAPNLHISQRLVDRKFKIAGGLPGQEVSWMVTGIRQDAWAKANRIQVEEDKPADDRGTYLHPELFGQSEEMTVDSHSQEAK